jgi:hypothetical protein
LISLSYIYIYIYIYHMQTTFLDTCKSFTLTAVTIFSVKFILDSKIFSWQQIFQDNNILFSLWSLPSRFYPSICIYKYSQVIISSLFFYRWSDSGLKGGLLCFQHEEKKRRSLYIYIYIYIYVQQLYIKEEGKCRIMNQGWIDTDF